MATDLALPKVAVAASGLGHIPRGIESWAQDVADALRHRAIAVELFGAAPGANITVVPCLKRTAPSAEKLVRFFRQLGGWRYGFDSEYDLEQMTFAFNLWRRIRRDFDILHVQDPTVATIMDRFNRMGLSRPRVILANGTGTDAKILSGLSYVQELLPPALAKWDALAGHKPRMFLAPNFIDMEGFAPGDRHDARRRMGLPADAFIVFCAAAIRRFHKRMDYLLREFAAFAKAFDRPALLMIAGGRESDTDEIILLGEDLLGDRVRFFVGAPRGDMPVLYRAADVFTITSLYETGSIAVIEALGTGLPVVCHDEPNFHALGGPSNRYIDMTEDGALATTLGALASSPKQRDQLATASRGYAEATFSADVVIDRILDMYRQVMAGPGA